MSWGEIEAEYGIPKEKFERMAAFTGSEGGRLELPKIGETIVVEITSPPFKVDRKTLEERGFTPEDIERILSKLPVSKRTGERGAWFVRVLHSKSGDERDMIEYDMPVSKTLYLQLKREAVRNNLTMDDLVGKRFRITGKEWVDAPDEFRRGKGKVKTYVVRYIGSGRQGLAEEEVELEL